MEGGIRYFDTAPNYFLSEERLGPALAPVRDTVFLATKLDHPDAKAAEQDLMTSLKLLKTDHVDLLLLHGFYDRAFRYVLSVPGVYCALIGAASVDKVNRAVKAARENDS